MPNNTTRTEIQVATDPAKQSRSRKPRRPNRNGISKSFVTGFLVVIAGVLGGAFLINGGFGGGGGGAAEEAAAAELKQLGALVVHSSGKKWVDAVNLSIVSDPEKFRQTLPLLKNFPKLQSLIISNPAVTDNDLVHVGQLTQLAVLTAKDCRITDAGLKNIAGLANLQTLYLVGTDITSESFQVLSQFEKMKIMDLSYNKKLNGGFEKLDGLPQLNWLLLNGLKVQDESIASLSKLSSLTRISLSETDGVQSSIDKLKSGSSKLTIDQ